jgi:broad specificity phosphatase PhoE
VTADQILLWRHGRTASNADGRFQGQQDISMDDVGLVQVKQAAELLASLIGTSSCHLVSSDLGRAVMTAQALADRLRIQVNTDPELREVDAGAWEGLLRSEIAASFPEELTAWRAGEDVRVGGGERRSEAGARAERAIRRHAAQVNGGVVVIASHGAALRGALMSLLDVDVWAWNVLDGLRNAHWADLRRRGDSWILSAYNVGPFDELDDGTR